MTVNEGIAALLAGLATQMSLDSETEQELLDEMRLHLEDIVAEEMAGGATEQEALATAAARFGLEEAGAALQAVHVGWGTAEAVMAAGLPVLGALVLRWLVYAPDGTVLAWQQVLARPVFWIVALAALLIPTLKLGRWRYALVSWGIFWCLTVVFVVAGAVNW